VPPVTHHNGSFDTFSLSLNKEGAYQQNRFYGVNQGYQWYYPAKNIAVDIEGNLITPGTETDTWLGDGGAVPMNPHSGWYNYDTEVIKLARFPGWEVYLPLVVQ